MKAMIEALLEVRSTFIFTKEFVAKVRSERSLTESARMINDCDSAIDKIDHLLAMLRGEQ